MARQAVKPATVPMRRAGPSSAARPALAPGTWPVCSRGHGRVRRGEPERRGRHVGPEDQLRVPNRRPGEPSGPPRHGSPRHGPPRGRSRGHPP